MPWAVAAGASGAIDSSKRTHGASANRVVEAPARADLDDRERPAELAETRPDRLAPGRVADRPDEPADVPEHLRRRRLDQVRRRSPAIADGRDADVDRLDPGVGRDDRVRRAQERFAEQFGDLRFADPGEPVGPRRDLRPEAAFAQAGHHLVGPHRPHLAGGPGSATMTRPSGATTNQPGAVPFGLASGFRRRDLPRLLEVELREGHLAPSPELAQPGLEVGVDGDGLATGGRDRLAGQVVRRRSEAAGARRRGPRGRDPPRTRRSRSRGRPGGRSSARPGRPRPVRRPASSPAFVSRVSPTVSSVPMLRSSAVSRRRGTAAVVPDGPGVSDMPAM